MDWEIPTVVNMHALPKLSYIFKVNSMSIPARFCVCVCVWKLTNTLLMEMEKT